MDSVVPARLYCSDTLSQYAKMYFQRIFCVWPPFIGNKEVIIGVLFFLRIDQLFSASQVLLSLLAFFL